MSKCMHFLFISVVINIIIIIIFIAENKLNLSAITTKLFFPSHITTVPVAIRRRRDINEKVLKANKQKTKQHILHIYHIHL